jgi:hypothetical protein
MGRSHTRVSQPLRAPATDKVALIRLIVARLLPIHHHFLCFQTDSKGGRFHIYWLSQAPFCH